jgi:hypothetical protein
LLLESVRSSALLFAHCAGLSWFNSGSGIYSQGRVIASTFNPTDTPRSQLLVGDLPQLGEALHAPVHDAGSLPPVEMIVKPIEMIVGENQIAAIELDFFTCVVRYSVESTDSSRYFALIGSPRTSDGEMPFVQLCSFVSCPSANSCNQFTTEVCLKFCFL